MQSKEPCPKCRESGNDNSGDNLVRYPDGGAFCFACKYTEKAGGKTPAKKSSLTISQILSYPVGTCPNRLIPEEVAEFFDVRHSVDTSTGKHARIYYPYYKDGKCVAAKVRGLDPKEFYVANKLETLFGEQKCTQTTGVLIVTEGEEDALAVKAMLNKPPTKNHDVVSLPNGGSLEKVTQSRTELFSKYKKVFLCFDADDVGKAAATEVADWMAAITNVYVAKLDPEIGKDASDYWVAGKTSEFKKAMVDAQLYEPDGVINGVDISLDSLLEPLEEGYPIPYPVLQDKLHGLRRGEIITLCAGSGIGKSTFSRELAKCLIEQGCSVANVALEDQMAVTAQALMALDMNIPLNRFRFHPPSKSETQPHYDKMVANGKTFFWKHWGGMNSETLMNKLYYYAKSKACDFIILDHLSLVISGSRINDERKAIDNLMTELAHMVVETGVGLIQIVHLKRPSGDKSFAKGGEVELSDLRGSAALEQLSWAVIGLERDQQGEDADFSRVRILKNRTFGFTGLCDTLKYDTETGRLLPFELDSEPSEEDSDGLLS